MSDKPPVTFHATVRIGGVDVTYEVPFEKHTGMLPVSRITSMALDVSEAMHVLDAADKRLADYLTMVVEALKGGGA